MACSRGTPGSAARFSCGAAAPVAEPRPAAGVAPAADAPSEHGAATRPPRRNWTWAQLMARAFEVDVFCCRRCGGRLRLIATILDPHAIRALLRSPALPIEITDRAPPVRLAADAFASGL